MDAFQRDECLFPAGNEFVEALVTLAPRTPHHRLDKHRGDEVVAAVARTLGSLHGGGFDPLGEVRCDGLVLVDDVQILLVLSFVLVEGSTEQVLHLKDTKRLHIVEQF